MEASLSDTTPRPKSSRAPTPAAAGSRSNFGAVVVFAGLLAAFATGCRLTPLTNRDWAPELSRMAAADFDGDHVRVHNVRNSNYRTDTDFDLRYEDRTYDLTKLDSVDYILVPLAGMPRIAHTFISFGFQGQDYLAISIEVRRLRGQPFKPLYNFLNENEIIYIAGDERDLIRSAVEFPQGRCLRLSRQADAESVPGPIRRHAPAGQQAFHQAGVLQHADEQLRNQPDRSFEPRLAAEDSV